MKNFILFSVLYFTTVLFTSCNKEIPQRDIKIKKGSCNLVADKRNIAICFDSLINESRCPVNIDIYCIWGGYASAAFRLNTGGVSTTFKLSTLNVGNLHTDTVINNIKITLKDILPYPGADNTPEAKETVAILEVQ